MTTNYYGLNLTKKWTVFTECTLAKWIQRRHPRDADNIATGPGRSMFFDLASFHFKTNGENEYIWLLVHTFSSLKFDMDTAKKSDLFRKI